LVLVHILEAYRGWRAANVRFGGKYMSRSAEIRGLEL